MISAPFTGNSRIDSRKNIRCSKSDSSAKAEDGNFGFLYVGEMQRLPPINSSRGSITNRPVVRRSAPDAHARKIARHDQSLVTIM